MSSSASNMTTVTGLLVSLSVHALIGSAVIVMPPIRGPVGGDRRADRGVQAMLIDLRSLPPMDQTPVPPEPERAQEPPEPTPARERVADFTPPEVKLGVQDSRDARSETWLQSVASGEHGAAPSQIEQPALSRTGGRAGSPAPSAQPSPPAPPASAPREPASASGATGQPPSASPADALNPARSPSAPATPGENTQPRPDLATGPQTQPARPGVEGRDRPERQPPAPSTPRPELALAPRERAEILERAPGPLPPRSASDHSPEPEQPVPAQPATQSASPTHSGAVTDAERRSGNDRTGGKPEDPVLSDAPPTPASPPTPAPAALPGEGGKGEDFGDPADRDSDPSTKKISAVYRSGRVDAGEGLEVRTVRPKFSLTAQTFSSPGNPLVKIAFARDGRVRRVEVLRSSGFPGDIDEPIVTAIYNWRASGRALDELPDRPDATVELTLRVLLR